jgi:ubiquitin-protein ligase
MKRMQKEISYLHKNLESGVELEYSDDLKIFTFHLQGPSDSMYEKYIYDVKVDIPDDYPFSPPVVTFISPIFHPNVNSKGDVCLNILGMWDIKYSINDIIVEIKNLLREPNISNPLSARAATLYLADKEEFRRKVDEICRM